MKRKRAHKSKSQINGRSVGRTLYISLIHTHDNDMIMTMISEYLNTEEASNQY